MVSSCHNWSMWIACLIHFCLLCLLYRLVLEDRNGTKILFFSFLGHSRSLAKRIRSHQSVGKPLCWKYHVKIVAIIADANWTQITKLLAWHIIIWTSMYACFTLWAKIFQSNSYWVRIALCTKHLTTNTAVVPSLECREDTLAIVASCA